MGGKHIPRLRALCPDIRLRPEPARIIEAPGPDAGHLGACAAPCEQRGAAFSAESTCGRVAARTESLIERWLANQNPQLRSGHDDSGRVSGATGALAVAAVTVDHRCGCCRTFIADRATGTSTAEHRRCWCLHRLPPVGVFRVTWHIFHAAGPRRFGSAEDACFREFLWSDIKGAGRYDDRFSAATHSWHRAAAMPAEPSRKTACGG